MKKLMIVIMLFLPSLVFASDYDQISKQLFSKIKTGEYEEAMNSLYDTNPWVSKNSDQVINIKAQLSSLDGLVGKYLFHELISEEKVGTHFVHLIYMVGYERQPLRFELQLYKVGSTWRFQSFSFDADLQEDIGKLANMKLVD
ncbi:hypothetical protein BIT28_25065 [Photobacterium proteolyticum]|uniref:DUF4019 domain-containing protein n=1 Tax=Photobacterium proteolyticum TaxID=1903952 RepID=A0A1Q9GD47_9GAMM|nr:hypothetical protein [Photobacterium proteolyticum]OLQ72286.1 hypothetical protein BIT28_25065 [Photobacterium proteolyticum]